MTIKSISKSMKNKIVFSIFCFLCAIFMNCATMRQEVVRCEGNWFSNKLGIYSFQENEFIIYGVQDDIFVYNARGNLKYSKEKITLQITHFFVDNRWLSVTGPASIYTIRSITENEMIWVDANKVEIIWNKIIRRNDE